MQREGPPNGTLLSCFFFFFEDPHDFFSRSIPASSFSLSPTVPFESLSWNNDKLLFTRILFFSLARSFIIIGVK